MVLGGTKYRELDIWVLFSVVGPNVGERPAMGVNSGSL